MKYNKAINNAARLTLIINNKFQTGNKQLSTPPLVYVEEFRCALREDDEEEEKACSL